MDKSPPSFRVAPDVVTHEIDEGLLIVNLQNGKTWKVNQVGASVFRGVEAGVEVSSLVTDLASRYRVETEMIRKDLDALLSDLQKQGLVECVTAG